jgi:hypothetical protein
LARYDTVSNIIADVGSELGLGTLTAVLPVTASTDAVVVQLQALLKAAGRGLVLENPWLQQRTDYTFNTTTATVYNLPAAFQRMVDGSGWNRTKRMPLVPLSPQAWEGMKAIAVTSALPVFFRMGVEEPATGQNTLELLATPASGEAIYLEYWSRLWARPSGATPTFLDAPTAVTDTLRIDAQLVTRRLKMDWLRAKGFDSTAAQQDYETTLDAVKAAAVASAPTLSLNGGQVALDRLLDGTNIPETGYGA